MPALEMYSRPPMSRAIGPFKGRSASRALDAEAASSLPLSVTRPSFSTLISSIRAHFLGDGGGAHTVLVLVADRLRELPDHVDSEAAHLALRDGTREIGLRCAGDVVRLRRVEFADGDRDQGVVARESHQHLILAGAVLEDVGEQLLEDEIEVVGVGRTETVVGQEIRDETGELGKRAQVPLEPALHAAASLWDRAPRRGRDRRRGSS